MRTGAQDPGAAPQGSAAAAPVILGGLTHAVNAGKGSKEAVRANAAGAPSVTGPAAVVVRAASTAGAVVAAAPALAPGIVRQTRAFFGTAHRAPALAA